MKITTDFDREKGLYAIPFYEKLGMKKADEVMKYNHIEWTEFTVE